MSGGHGHASEAAGHGSGGHSSGGHSSGGHGSGGHGAGTHGPVEIPAAPATRSITPARGDFEQPWPGSLLWWPVVWTVVGAVFALAAQRWSGPVDLQSAHGGAHPASPPHGAPSHAPAGH